MTLKTDTISEIDQRVKKNTLRVKFCSHGYATTPDGTERVAINPAWLYIQRWYELHGLTPNIEWLPPGVLVFDSVDTIIQNIIDESPDIVGLGVYIWNINLQIYIAERLKKLNPNIIIVAGGPQLSAHKTNDDSQDDFFERYPFFDYVGYGDGERPMQQIIDYHSGYLPDKKSFVNIVENVNGKRKIYPYEMISDHEYLSTSPFLTQEKHMFEIRDYIVAQGVPLDQQSWTIEFARGCMYSCTFCDWGQNLTKKVKRRTHSWKEDLDLFCRMNVAIRESDANFGQWEDDIRAYDYGLSLYDSNRHFQFAPYNTPKLKKEATQYIMINNALTYNIAPKISLQDIDQDVLEAINRPNISWEQLVDMVANMKAQLPLEKFKKLKIESMLALPGQSYDGVVNSMFKLYEIGVLHHTWSPWVMLPNSPGYDANYRKLWGVEVKDVYIAYNTNVGTVSDLEQLYQNLTQTKKYLGQFVKQDGVVATRTMSLHHMWAVKKLNMRWDELNEKIEIFNYTPEQVKGFLMRIKALALKEAEQQLSYHQPLIDKYNCIVWAHYDPYSKQITDTL